jgi:hypothetical protein
MAYSNLITELLGQNNFMSFMYSSRLDRYIDSQKDELLSLSYFHKDSQLTEKMLNGLIGSRLSPLSDFISNEIFFDLIISYKNNDFRFKGRRELEKIIRLTYIKYAQFIRVKIASFYSDLSKLRTKLKKEKWKIKKIKRVPQVIEPVKITLDIRFAVIKRANGKCDGCSSSIHENPIEVYQVKVEDQIKFVAFCENCREKNIEDIQEEPKDQEEHDRAT